MCCAGATPRRWRPSKCRQTKPDGITPSQTVGPFFAYGLTPNGKYDWNDAFTNNLVTPDTSGERIRIEGRVFDGDGAPVPDCMLEIWQADAQGRFADPQDKRALPNSSFKGFGRFGTDANGGYAFDTIKPGQVADPDGKPQAPHILLAVFARGMLLHLYTRIYFDGEAANAADPVLALVPADRRAHADRDAQAGHGNAVYRLRHPPAGRQRDGVLRRLRDTPLLHSGLSDVPPRYDVVVIGAGAAGMSAALFAAIRGAKTLLVEKTAFVGGTSALSAGSIWIPNTRHAVGGVRQRRECRAISAADRRQPGGCRAARAVS